MASNNFINECQNYANCNRLGELKVRDDINVQDLEGYSSQVTTTQGANLCPPPTDSKWTFSGDATLTSDGYLSIPSVGSSATITVPWDGSRYMYVKFIVVSGGNYHINTSYLDSSKSRISGNGAAGGDKGSNYQYSNGFGGSNQYGDALTQSSYVSLSFAMSSSSAQYGVTNAYVVKDILISSSNISYEPFVPTSPSPDYPSEIRTITGSTTINVCEENLFDINWLNMDDTVVENGVVTGQAKAFRTNFGLNGAYIPNTNYGNNRVSISIDGYTDGNSATTSNNGVRLVVYYTDGATQNICQFLNSETTKTTKTGTSYINKTIKNIQFVYGNEANNIWHFSNIMITYGTTVKPYKEYVGKRYEINLGKNIFNGFTKGIGLNSTNGSQTTNSNAATSDYISIDFVKNSYYYLSGLLDTMSSFVAAYNSSKQFLGRCGATLRKEIALTKAGFGSGTAQGTGDIAYLRVTQYSSTVSIDNIDNAKVQLEAGGNKTSYSPYFTPIELAGIPNGDEWIARDKIFQSSGQNIAHSDNFDTKFYLIGSSGQNREVGERQTNLTGEIIEVKPNTTYTASGDFSALGSSNIRIGYFDSVIQVGSISTAFFNGTSPCSFTTGANTKYILVYNSNDSSGSKITNFMLNEGTTALPYEPYGNDWYIKKEVGKVTFNGTDEGTWQYTSGDHSRFTLMYDDLALQLPNSSSALPITMSDKFTSTNASRVYSHTYDNSISGHYTYSQFWLYTSLYSDTTNLKNWLSTLKPTIYYEKKTPSYTKVTGELLQQLEELKNAIGYFEVTNINTDSSTLPITMNYTLTEGPTLNQDNYIQDFSIDSGCYVDGGIIGTNYAKKLETNLLASASLDLENKEVRARVGVKYSNDTIEYEELGKFTVEKPTDEQVENSSQIVAYDDLINHLDDVYSSELDYESETVTLGDVYEELCSHLELTPKTTTFTNSTIVVSANPFTNGEKNREALKSIEKVSCSFVDIDRDNNTIDLVWLSDTLDYTFSKDDYSSLEGGKTVYGPINSLVIKNSQIDDENVSISDDISIAQNGEHQLVIAEDYFLYDEDLREAAINGIWAKVNGLTYVDCKITTYTGKPFLKIGNKIRVYTDTNEYFDTYVLKHNYTYDGSFKSVIESPCLTEQEVKTKQDISLQEKLRNTQIIVNKQTGEISSLVVNTDVLNTTATNALGLANTANAAANSVNTDLQAYKNTVSSQFTQTANDYTLLFTQAITAANDAAETEESHYQTQQQYIRFAGDTITLGKSDSQLTAELSSSELAFKQGNEKVAYISNNKMFITEAEITTSLTLGNFGFVPRDNGSLSFRKVK
ncbi:MAG: hypothetical protein J6T15_03710 [Bacilli bacterium]|nr:hypothetical protein [Bacilli bacterium]